MTVEKAIFNLLEDPVFFAVVVLLISKLQSKTSSSYIGLVLFNLLGTFLHELMHLLFSLVLNGKPVKFSIFPQKNGSSYVLGSVKNRNITNYNAFPISMSPLLLLYLSFELDQYFFYFFAVELWSYLTYVFVLVMLITNSIPSKQDFKVLLSKPIGSLIYVAGLSSVFFYSM